MTRVHLTREISGGSVGSGTDVPTPASSTKTSPSVSPRDQKGGDVSTRGRKVDAKSPVTPGQHVRDGASMMHAPYAQLAAETKHEQEALLLAAAGRRSVHQLEDMINQLTGAWSDRSDEQTVGPPQWGGSYRYRMTKLKLALICAKLSLYDRAKPSHVLKDESSYLEKHLIRQSEGKDVRPVKLKAPLFTYYQKDKTSREYYTVKKTAIYWKEKAEKYASDILEGEELSKKLKLITQVYDELPQRTVPITEVNAHVPTMDQTLAQIKAIAQSPRTP